MASISTWKSHTSALVDMIFAARVSSAELETHAVAPYLSVSQMSTRNKNGPRTDPCGIPDVTSAGILFVPLTNTACLRLVTKACTHLPSFPDMPFSFFSLSRGNRLCQKPGKGLYKLHPHFAHFPGVLRYDHSVMIVSYWLTKAGSTQSKAMLSRVEEIIFFHISNYMLLQNILK